MRHWSWILACLGLSSAAAVSVARMMPVQIAPVPIRITAAAFSPDGQRVLVLYDTGNREIWSAATGEVLQTLFVPVVFTSAWPRTLSSKALFSALPTPGAIVLEARSPTSDEPQAVVKQPVGEDAVVATIAVSANGQRALTGHPGGTLRVWNLADGKLIRTIAGKQSCNPYGLAISPDGTRGLSLGHGGEVNSKVILWDLDTGTTSRIFEGLGDTQGPGPAPLAFSPDGKWATARRCTVWTTSQGRQWKIWTVIWEVATGKAANLFADATFLAFTPDSQHVLLNHGADIRLWSIVEGVEKWQLSNQEDWHTVVFTPDGKTLLTIGGARYGFGSPPDATCATLWDAETGKPIRLLKRPSRVSQPPVKPADANRWTWRSLFKWK